MARFECICKELLKVASNKNPSSHIGYNSNLEQVLLVFIMYLTKTPGSL